MVTGDASNQTPTSISINQNVRNSFPWVEVISAAPAALLAVGFFVPGNWYGQAVFEVGIGAAGSEAAVADSTSIATNSSSSRVHVPLRPPGLIPSGSRVSCRMVSTENDTQLATVSFTLFTLLAASVTNL